jgi:hypothetical protein
MRNEIIEKLRPILTQSVETEERVVYIMVEVRKLMEHANLPDNQLVTLRFFCNWVAHTKLTRGEGVEIVKLMNDLYAARLSGQWMTDEQHQRLHGLFSFDTFRQQLLGFLRAQGLNWAMIELLPEWIKFVRHYAAVVADCPITYGKKDLQLRWMDRAIVSICEVDQGPIGQAPTGHPVVECPLDMRWTFFKREREVMKWEVPITYEDCDKGAPR